MSADETTSAQTRFFVDRLGDGAIKEFRVTSTQSFFTPFDPIAAAFCSAVLTFQFASYQRLEMNAWLIATILISCFVIYSKVNRVKDESVLVIKELGIQLKKRYFTGRERNSFIDANRIESVVINESFHRCQVIFYLAFREKGRDSLHLAFEDMIPRLPVLVKVLRGIRAVLYGESEIE